VSALPVQRHVLHLEVSRYIIGAGALIGRVCTEACAAPGGVIPQGPELHLDMSTLQRPKLLLDMSALQGPELHLDMSTLKRHVIHLDLSTRNGLSCTWTW
jgi:hypothetical protein